STFAGARDTAWPPCTPWPGTISTAPGCGDARSSSRRATALRQARARPEIRWDRSSRPARASGHQESLGVGAVPLALLVLAEPERGQGIDVGAVPVLRAVRQVSPHARLGVRREWHIEARVDAPDGGHWVPDEIDVSDVEDLVGRRAAVGASLEAGANLVGRQLRHLAPDQGGVDRVAE